MPTPCVIRFTDDDADGQAHVFRKRHGHPEEVITNLSSLQQTFEQQRGEESAGNIAARFVFLDTLWYALRDTPIEEVVDELWMILYSPAQTRTLESDSYLNQHAILDSTTSIESDPYFYVVEISENDWLVKIGENDTPCSWPVEEAFQSVSWRFTGELSEAVSKSNDIG